MNVIWRNCICRLRQGKVPHRCQSSIHPVAPLGSRILTDPAKVFEHNMWDHMQWSKEEEDEARKKVEENSATRVAPEEQVKFETDANKYWDTFYQTHKNKFFKNRNWLLREFPEILPVDRNTKENVGESSWDRARSSISRTQGTETHCQESFVSSEPGRRERSASNPDWEENSRGPRKAEQFPGSKATFRILEVGCGAGNSVFPILNTLRNIPGFFLYCCDFAPEAVELVKVRKKRRKKTLRKSNSCFLFLCPDSHMSPTARPTVLPLFMTCVTTARPTLFQTGPWMPFSLSLCSRLFTLTGCKLSSTGCPGC